MKKAILLAIILADRNEDLQILSLFHKMILTFHLQIEKKKKPKELVLGKGGSFEAYYGSHSVTISQGCKRCKHQLKVTLVKYTLAPSAIDTDFAPCATLQNKMDKL